MTRAALAAAVLMLLATPAIAQADANPCTPENTTVLFDPAVGARGNQGEATGVQKVAGVWTFLRCEMTLDPAAWATDTPAERCQVKAHELVHLIRGDDLHAPSGLMAPVPGYFAPCRTLRERVRHDLEAITPFGGQVACGRWEGRAKRAFTCLTDWADTRGRYFERHYRVRTRGDAYAIHRLPSR